MIKKISSKDNKYFKKIKSLKRKNSRVKNKLFLIEGKKVFVEALDSRVKIESIFVKEDFNINTLIDTNLDIFILEENLFKELTDMENPEGIIAACKIEESERFSKEENIIVLDGIRDPGNMGTIIRSAESFGYKQIGLINDCVDIYNSKVIRGSMGSLFRTNIISLNLEKLKEIKNTHKLYCMALEEDSVSIYNMTESEKHAIIIGNEANGVSQEVLKISAEKVIIPLSGNVESLNAGVAASITMFYFNQIITQMEKKTISS
ncbi:TrmH family RNA methyltransferase [Miniphocaeibacter massiliensis]|uniref:TrmH family RNA methyltransferase n=1 Tax=Miniphocaeibacter massiliensis TaxID=2041841 RepID=UPI000C0788DE|nr:RNA methyltransferase [Miniphocaeibacter massiliensis]